MMMITVDDDDDDDEGFDISMTIIIKSKWHEHSIVLHNIGSEMKCV